MPHFVIDMPKGLIKNEEKVLQEIHKIAFSSGLFTENDIKVRINSYVKSIIGGKEGDFIYLVASMLEGREESSKRDLLANLVLKLTELYPNVESIGANIIEHSKSTYVNRNHLK